MKVAILTDGLFPEKVGGMQKHSLFLAQEMAKSGVEVYLMYASDESSASTSNFPEITGLHYIPVKRPLVKYFPGHYLYYSYLLSKEMFANCPEVDFIIAQGFTGWYFNGKTKTQLATHPHGLEMYQEAVSLKDKVEKWMMRMAMGKVMRHSDFVMSLGKGMVPIIEKAVGKNVKILPSPNGISENWLENHALVDGKRNLIRFLFVGRYERRKGIEEFTSVAKNLLEKGEKFEVWFIGPIPRENQVDHPSFQYYGMVKDENRIKEILREADVFVSPSHAEGMPTVILEAMASSLPVIATDVGTVRSMVDDKSGWLIEAKNKEMLEKAMKKAMALPRDLLLEMGNEGRKRVENKFLWPQVAKTTIFSIENALKAWKRESI